MLKHHQNIFLWFKNNSKELLPKKIDKIRIGNNRDGGYVIPKSAINDCDLCVSFGLGNNTSYEKHLISKGKRVIGYDILKSKERWSRIMMLKTYDDFKYIPEVKESNNILLKMDIEGGEWGFMETLDVNHFRDKVHTFAFEIHFTINPNNTPLCNINKILDTHYVVNIHPNNYGGYIDYIPIALEITLINKKFLKYPSIDEHPTYLNYKNNPKAPNLLMRWIK